MPNWKIIYFGCASPGTFRRKIGTLTTKGTKRYLSPEMYNAQPGVPAYSNRLDVWSLGCILYELCTGVAAFQYESTFLLYIKVRDSPPQVTPLSPNESDDRLLRFLWETLKSKPEIELFKQFDRQPDVNEAIASMLALEPGLRPSAKELQLHSAGLLLQSMWLEHQPVSPLFWVRC